MVLRGGGGCIKKELIGEIFDLNFKRDSKINDGDGQTKQNLLIPTTNTSLFLIIYLE